MLFFIGVAKFQTVSVVLMAPFPSGAVSLAIRETQQLFLDLLAIFYLLWRNFYTVLCPVFNRVLRSFAVEL